MLSQNIKSSEYLKNQKLYEGKRLFSLKFFDKTKISKEINTLEKKACQENGILVKLIKSNKSFFYHNFNNALFSSNFSSNIKAADILPTHKKKDKSNIENYSPISFLPTLFKIYERSVYNQMCKYFDHLFSKYQCGFRRGYNTQHCLLVMVEKWKKVFDKGGLNDVL